MGKFLSDGKFPDWKHLFMFLGAGILLFFMGELFLTQVWAITSAILLAAIAVFIFEYVDSKIFKGVDTFKEIIHKRNIAYAIFMLAISFLISIPFLAAFIVYFSAR